jgi:hypothetical protein
MDMVITLEYCYNRHLILIISSYFQLIYWLIYKNAHLLNHYKAITTCFKLRSLLWSAIKRGSQKLEFRPALVLKLCIYQLLSKNYYRRERFWDKESSLNSKSIFSRVLHYSFKNYLHKYILCIEHILILTFKSFKCYKANIL